jgi:putative aldouronate transport system permease protein
MNKRAKTSSAKLKNLISDIKRDAYLYLLLLFPMLYYFVFKYIPMYGVTIAFKDYNMFQGILQSSWVGLDVFKEIWNMPEFYRAVGNTLVLNMLDLIFSFPAPIILAILLNEVRISWFKRTAQTIFYLPYFLSWVIIGGIAYQILSPVTGLFNIALKSIGLPAIPFLTKKVNWLLSYLGIGIWQSAGWGTIIYLAAISGINHELYEAAQVDGAGRLRQIWHITLPGIKPTIIILLILNLGRIMMSSFDRPYVIGNAYVSEISDVISTFVYRVGIKSVRYSLATAVGLFQSLVGMILLLISNYIANKSGEQGIW